MASTCWGYIVTAIPRVLYVVESWLPRLAGYTTRSWQIVKAQQETGVADPQVLVTSRQATYGESGVQSAQVPTTLVSVSTRERWARRVRPFYVDTGALQAAIEQQARRTNAQLIHVHWSSGIGMAARRAADALGLPLVAEVRFDLAGAVMTETIRLDLPLLESVLRRRFERHLNGAAAVVAASHTLARLVADSFPDLDDRLYVVPNGVDLDHFAPDAGVRQATRARLGLSDAFVVGSTTNMLRYEGLDVLIDSAAHLERPIHLLLVGDGTQSADLESLASKRGVEATFVGRVPFAEVPGYLSAMDVFAVPRRDASVTRFASPIKAVEAMAMGVPIVASSVGDLPDLLSDGRGLVIPPGDRPALCQAIDTLRDEGVRSAIGKRAHDWARVSASWSDTVQPYRSAYAHALANR